MKKLGKKIGTMNDKTVEAYATCRCLVVQCKCYCGNMSSAKYYVDNNTGSANNKKDTTYGIYAYDVVKKGY